MAALTLTTVWLNSAEDLSDVMAFPNMSALQVGGGMEGQVRTLPAGRNRLFERVGRQRTTAVTFPGCDREQIQWLEDNTGKLVCVRDDRGRKLYGVYASVQTDEVGVGDRGHAAVTLLEVTHSEEV